MVQVGDWVEVQEDYAPGRCSEGGLGTITTIHRGVDPEECDVLLEEASLVDVKYMLTGWVERQIPLTRLHAVPFVIKVSVLSLFSSKSCAIPIHFFCCC